MVRDSSERDLKTDGSGRTSLLWSAVSFSPMLAFVVWRFVWQPTFWPSLMGVFLAAMLAWVIWRAHQR